MEKRWLYIVFSSLVFIFLFLPITFLIYSFGKSIKYKNIVLLIASLLFYAWGEPIWIIVLILSAIVNYVFSHLIERSRGSFLCKASLITSIAISLGLLVFFKYSNFIVNNINIISPIKFSIHAISMPIGISFYTFELLTYIIDVYNKKTRASNSILNLLMYTSLFTQVMMGPIVRYVDIEEQLAYRQFSLDNLASGLTKFLVGLSKKVLIANYASKLVSDLLNMNVQGLSMAGMWLGIILYALQIYFDFSGYSDMAIGIARMFGFNFKENFEYPYVSTSITDFWRRWHISLGSFFREYVYIPLGGNRHDQIRNLLVVWFLTGLWHGASWNFILWGLYFFVFLVIEKFLLLKYFKKIPKVISHVYFLIIILVGWILFYFTNMIDLRDAVKIMFGFTKVPFLSTKVQIIFLNNYIFIIIAILACLPIVKYLKNLLNVLFNKSKFGVYATIASKVVINLSLMFMSLASLVGSSYSPFLYFKF